jgi:hypothetical protein
MSSCPRGRKTWASMNNMGLSAITHSLCSGHPCASVSARLELNCSLCMHRVAVGATGSSGGKDMVAAVSTVLHASWTHVHETVSQTAARPCAQMLPSRETQQADSTTWARGAPCTSPAAVPGVHTGWCAAQVSGWHPMRLPGEGQWTGGRHGWGCLPLRHHHHLQ